MKTVMDLNADMGEGFGPYRVADDAALIPYLTSANIAGGFHAGDPATMRRTAQLAAEHGVAVGVHPGYRDLVGFGRRELSATPEELRDDVLYQLGALREMARYCGQRVQHLKLHGALYMRAARDRELSHVILEGVQRVDPTLIIFCMRASETYEVAQALGQPVAIEFYADREYGEDGAILFTRTPPRLEPDAVAKRVLRAVTEGTVVSASGKDVEIAFDTICVHSDTPGVADIAKTIRERLAAGGVELAPAGESLAPA